MIAAVTNAGVGPFSVTFTVETPEDCKYRLCQEVNEILVTVLYEYTIVDILMHCTGDEAGCSV